MSETLKDFLVGVKFNVDTAGADKADQAISGLDDIIRQLGEVLTQAAAAFQALISQMQGGKDTVDETSVSMENGAESAGEMEQALRKVNKEGKLTNLSQGKHNVNSLNNAMKKASSTLKKFAKLAIGYLIGSNVVNAFKSLIEFNENLAKSAKELGKTVEQTRAYNLALRVMGKTAKEIEQDKSLQATFENLQNIGNSLALPEAAAGLRNIGAVKDALMELKMVGSYALQWIYYKAQEVAAGPLAETRKILGDIRGWLSGNIQNIAAGIAKAFSWVVQIINSVAIAIGKVLGWINQLPPAIKIAGAVAIAVIMAVKSKTALITMIITGILLLIDDFVTYMEGGESLFGDFWGALLDWIEKIQPYVEEFIGYFEEGLKAIGDAIVWLCDLLGTDTIIAIGLVGAALWALSANPIVLIISAVIALIAGLGWLVKNWDKVKEAAAACWESIVEWCGNAWSKIEELWGKLGEWFSGIWESIQADPELATIVDALLAPFKSAWEGIKIVWDAVSGYFADIWNAITSGEGISSVLSAISKPFVDAYNTIVDTFANLNFDDVLKTASEWATTAWNNIKTAFSTADTWFTTNVVEPIKDAFSGIGEWFSSTFSEAWKAVEDIFGKVGEWAAGIWDGIAGGIQNAVNWASNAAKDAGSWITQAGVDVGDFLKDGWQNGWGLWGNGDQNEPVAIEVDTKQVEEAQTAVEAFEAALAGIANNGTLDTWYEEQFESIVNTVQQGADKVDEIIALCRSAIDELSPAALTAFEIVVNSFAGIRNSITKSMSASASAVSRSVASIKSALSSIPKNIAVNIGANITQNYQSALATLGGSATSSPTSIFTGLASKITNNSKSNNINTQSTFNVYGTDAKTAASQAVSQNANLWVRNIKSLIGG